MTAVTRPRGPLPPRVYWVRRVFVLLVLVLVLALVWGLARLLGGDGGGGSSASPVVAEREPTTTPSAAPEPRSDRQAARRERRTERRAEDALAEPSGPCLDSDVVVTPDVVEPYVGRPEVVLRLTTVESEACTWDVTPDSVFLVISDEKGPLWSSQDCPAAIPSEEVVARQEKAAVVEVAWNGKQSDRDCSEATDWVWPGKYVATAVARGSVTPVEVPFEMTRMVVTDQPTEEDPEEVTDRATDRATEESGRER